MHDHGLPVRLLRSAHGLHMTIGVNLRGAWQRHRA